MTKLFSAGLCSTSVICFLGSNIEGTAQVVDATKCRLVYLPKSLEQGSWLLHNTPKTLGLNPEDECSRTRYSMLQQYLK